MSDKRIETTPIMLVNLREVGDVSRYLVAVGPGPTKDVIYVALGGQYAPTAGGLFPLHMIEEFGRDVIDWAYGSDGDFYEHFSAKHYINYMWSKQVSTNTSKWELVVATFCAWAYTNNHVLDADFMQIIGACYTNRNELAVLILKEAFSVGE